MSDDEIKKLLICAIQTLIIQDKWLLEKNLSERSISHKLAEYLQPLFREYDVDCEYNGNVEDSDSNYKKNIDLLKSKLEEIQMKLTVAEIADAENDFTTRAVFPDIIIHKRGSNEKNICIIEVKKSGGDVKRRNFDDLKLQAYTGEENRTFKYELGAYIEFGVSNKSTDYVLNFYKDGKREN